jgi:hypothetical protein
MNRLHVPFLQGTRRIDNDINAGKSVLPFRSVGGPTISRVMWCVSGAVGGATPIRIRALRRTVWPGLPIEQAPCHQRDGCALTGPSIGGGFRKLLIEQLKVRTVKARLMQSFLAAEQVSWPQAAPYRCQASLFERTTIAIDVAASSISTAGHSKGQIRHYGFHFVPLSRRSLESVTCRLSAANLK